MSTESSTTTTTTLSGMYSDSSNTAIIIILISFSGCVILVNLSAIIGILRHSSTAFTGVFICYLSTVEVFHAVACATTTIYSYFGTEDSFQSSSTLCSFYGWLYVVFRVLATLVVSVLVLDRVVLSFYPTFYVRTWSSVKTRWILGSLVLILGLLIGSLPLGSSSYDSSPDGRRFHCFLAYTGSFAVFYIVFHLVQTVFTVVVMPWVISREKRVDARLSVLLVGEMVVCREGRNVVSARDFLKISRLVIAVVLLYHVCAVFLPLLLLLGFFDVNYPSVMGLLALQLPTFGALFLPVVYGLTWRPYRRAYYNSVACLCPPSRQQRSKSVRSMYNHAFRETREYDKNSILHTRGVSLQPSATTDLDASSQPSTSSPSQPLELDPRQLDNGTAVVPDNTSRPSHVAFPRTTSFQDRHFYMPSKFQNIFEIIDALSAPNRDSVDDRSDCSSITNTPRGLHDSWSSISSAGAVKLNDVSLDMPDIHANPFKDVDFSSIHFPSGQYGLRKVNKIKLESERSNSFQDPNLGERDEEQLEETSSLSGPIRFTDLKKVRTEKSPENLGIDSPFANNERYRKYLASENHVNPNEQP